jgi:hypothetical protein
MTLFAMLRSFAVSPTIRTRLWKTSEPSSSARRPRSSSRNELEACSTPVKSTTSGVRHRRQESADLVAQPTRGLASPGVDAALGHVEAARFGHASGFGVEEARIPLTIALPRKPSAGGPFGQYMRQQFVGVIISRPERADAVQIVRRQNSLLIRKNIQ